MRKLIALVFTLAILGATLVISSASAGNAYGGGTCNNPYTNGNGNHTGYYKHCP